MLKTKKVVENKVETDDKVRTLDEEGRKEVKVEEGRNRLRPADCVGWNANKILVLLNLHLKLKCVALPLQAVFHLNQEICRKHLCIWSK